MNLYFNTDESELYAGTGSAMKTCLLVAAILSLALVIKAQMIGCSILDFAQYIK